MISRNHQTKSLQLETISTGCPFVGQTPTKIIGFVLW